MFTIKNTNIQIPREKKRSFKWKKIIHYTWRVTMWPKGSFLEQVTIKAALKDDHCQDLLEVYIHIMTLLSFFQWSKTRCDFVKRTLSANPKNGQTHSKVRRLLPRHCSSVFDPFVGLALKGLKKTLTKSTKTLHSFPPIDTRVLTFLIMIKK